MGGITEYRGQILPNMLDPPPPVVNDMSLSMTLTLGSTPTRASLPRLPHTNMEARYCNYIFLNNHRVVEEYEKYWHLCQTDLKIIDRLISAGSQKTPFKWNRVKATTGVYKAHLHQPYKPCVIRAILSHTYGNVWWCSHRFVMGLLQWHKVCLLDGGELHRPLPWP